MIFQSVVLPAGLWTAITFWFEVDLSTRTRAWTCFCGCSLCSHKFKTSNYSLERGGKPQHWSSWYELFSAAACCLHSKVMNGRGFKGLLVEWLCTSRGQVEIPQHAHWPLGEVSDLQTQLSRSLCCCYRLSQPDLSRALKQGNRWMDGRIMTERKLNMLHIVY